MKVATTKSFFTRTSLACEACRSRKRKCDGNSPCSYCVSKKRECSFAEKKKRGPKKRCECPSDGEETPGALIVSPSSKEIQMGEVAEAFTYVDACWGYLHRIHTLSTVTKIKNPVTTAQKVQAYAAFALTARLCGNKSRALTYMDQARTFAGQVFDSADCDSVAGLLLMSYFSMLVFDVPRALFYASLGASLYKLIPKEKQNYRLFVFCQVTGMMADGNSTREEKLARFEELTQFMQEKNKENKTDRFLPFIAQLTELNKAMSLIVDHSVFYTAPNRSSNVFNTLDDITISEDDRLRIIGLMDKILKIDHALFARTGGYIRKILVPVQRAILNWKSGHMAEAMECALACFSALQQMDKDCLYGLISSYPQIYLMGSLVKIFLEQNEFFLAQQMSEQVKKVCATMQPDLDVICEQMDQLILSHTPQPTTSTSTTISLYNPTLGPSKNSNLESTFSPSMSFPSSPPPPSLHNNNTFPNQNDTIFSNIYASEKGNLETTQMSSSSTLFQPLPTFSTPLHALPSNSPSHPPSPFSPSSLFASPSHTSFPSPPHSSYSSPSHSAFPSPPHSSYSSPSHSAFPSPPHASFHSPPHTSFPSPPTVSSPTNSLPAPFSQPSDFLNNIPIQDVQIHNQPDWDIESEGIFDENAIAKMLGLN